MYANDFSVRIPEGNETPGGYVEMQHGTQYTLVLRNNRNARCDAKVEVDGKMLGTFRIGAHSNIRLERPAHDKGCLTFYKLGTKEARQAEIDERDPDLGLVKVTFTPEVRASWTMYVSDPEPLKPPYTYWKTDCDSVSSDGGTYQQTLTNAITQEVSRSYSPGGTGLSGRSDQMFNQVGCLNYDYTQQTVIHLRLVAKESDEPRPLTSYSTPVPPRVN